MFRLFWAPGRPFFENDAKKRGIRTLMKQTGDFSKGSISGNILSLALPMVLAQLTNVLYSIVDRMYIGHIPGASVHALTGVGVTFPIITIIIAFANLFGTGGAPLFSIERGADHLERAQTVMGNTFSLLIASGAALTVVIMALKKPLLYFFGASDETFPYADAYSTLYLCGSVFTMISLGMNGFINAQGFGRKGMMTVLLGALVNIVLDPVFIFALRLGVRGAALATVISQFISALWVLLFLCGKNAPIRLCAASMRLRPEWARRITTLGLSGFIMGFTNSLVQVACNATLQQFGGDLYIGVMTVVNSIREIVTAPVSGLTNAAQPVMGYNYGAGRYQRVRMAIRFLSVVNVGYSVAVWLSVMLFPKTYFRLFSDDPVLLDAGLRAMFIYFFGFFMMSLQNAGQCVAVALGRSKQAIFFSLFRKVVIVVPLTLVLPRLFGLGADGVFLAEPISNFIGGAACFITMLLTIWPELKRREREEEPV